MMREFIVLFLKGMGIGAANVVPGVSGGTIALISGIFEKLIISIKSFDLQAIRYFFTGQFRKFSDHVSLSFLIAVFLGVFISILSFARLFGFLFDHYPIYIWSFFFGLILASVFFVGKNIEKWGIGVIISLIAGTFIAVIISLLKPAAENSSIFYLFICGIVATCSMIIPGLSGSFVLILMGNYRLIMIDSINSFDLKIILPVVIGAFVGLIALSRFLSWIFKNFKNQTLAVLTGFIVGSLGTLWPWKNVIFATNSSGEILIRNGKKIVEGYDWFLPDHFSKEVIFAILLIILGIAIIWITETMANNDGKKGKTNSIKIS